MDHCDKNSVVYIKTYVKDPTFHTEIIENHIKILAVAINMAVGWKEVIIL